MLAKPKLTVLLNEYFSVKNVMMAFATALFRLF